MQITNFDATNIPPQQMGSKHPKYMGPAVIANTYAEPTKDQKNGMFCVLFKTQVGEIVSRYNLWNESAKAVEIAQKELSALCHATGVFRLSMTADNLQMCGHELRNAQCVIEVDDQPNNPQYSEVKKVYDRNGNEPGKVGHAPQVQQGNAQQVQQPQQPANNGGWGQPTQQQSSAPQGGGWQQGPSNPPANTGAAGGQQGNAPPWARG
jgi:hypothetical protein